MAGLSIAIVLCTSLASCARAPAPKAQQTYPAIGTVVHLSDGRVRATGIVGQYPLNGPTQTFVDWVLYSRLGSDTTTMAVVGSLIPAARSADESEPLAAYDGKLVTIEGTLRAPQRRHFVSSPWSQLEVDSITVAPREAQDRIPWSGSLVKPGRWFDEPGKLALTRVYEEAAQQPNYPDVARAREAYGGRIPEPHSPRTGRLVGVVLPSMSDGSEEWYQFYSTGLVIAGPFHVEDGPDWIASAYEDERRLTSHTRLVRVSGRPGYIRGSGTPSNSLWFWDGEAAISLGSLVAPTGLSDEQLIEIAQSMTW